MAARAAREVQGTGAQVLDTRKTTPGLRALEKAAVAAGGAVNHRVGLFDAILIKENHIAAAGGIAAAVAQRAGGRSGAGRPPGGRGQGQREIEEALAAGAPRLLLDNMDAGAAARRGRAGRRPRGARGERRRRPGDAPGGRGDRGRMDLDGRADPQRSRPGSLPHTGGAAMNLPMAPAQASPLEVLSPRRSPSSRRRCARLPPSATR